MALEKIYAMLESCTTDIPRFPLTLLYNEGWLLRLILDWFSTHEVSFYPLAFSDNVQWFSEALLPSAFLTRHRGDLLAEAWTHLDGIIGHFAIGSAGKADLSLLPDATHLVALEAKMFSGLSSGVKNVKYFDQAARNVACIAEVLRRANRSPSDIMSLGFYILAPHSQIKRGIFSEKISREAIQQKVERRVQEYSGTKDQWYAEWFQPTFQQIEIGLLSWEEVIVKIEENDPVSAASIKKFYEHCLVFNHK